MRTWGTAAVAWARAVIVALATLAVVLGIGVAAPAQAAVAADQAPASATVDLASAETLSAGIVDAANLSNFDPGNIISDAVFFNSGTMTAAQIQSFLESKVPACQSGYTCLKDKYDVSRSTAADAMCGAYSGGVNERASTIIFKVAKACGINPQVILATLEKEQGLVRHTWPSEWRYTIAMGQGCPDTAACDTRYHGFFNQVYGAAWQLKRYANPPGTSAFFTWYAPGKTWNVLYNPNHGCGSAPVLIRNQATANLYYYTPYQPNRAALNAGYGSGDGCSSYGNRNFYNYFTDWFGSTQANPCGQPPYEQVRSASGTLVAKAALTARATASTACTSGTAAVAAGTKVTLAAQWNGWYWVKVAGGSYWIQKSELKKYNPCDQPPNAGVTSASGASTLAVAVTARTAPNMKCYTGMTTVKAGTQVTLLAAWDTWYWVQIGSKKLWVPKARVAVDTRCSQPPYNEVTGASGTFVLTAAVAARSTAHTKCYTGMVKLAAGTRVTAAAQWGSWYWVDVNGQKLWVPKGKVRAYQGCAQPPYEQVRGGSGRAVVLAGAAGRQGPSAECSEGVVKLTTGSSVRVAAQWKDWYWIETAAGRMLWVPSWRVDPPSPTTLITTDAVNLRASASTAGKVIVTLRAGTQVTMLSRGDGWYQVRTSAGNKGWVSGDYLR